MIRALKARAACRGRVFAVVLVCFASLAGAVASAADALTATITYPPSGATGVALSQPIQWTPVAGVQAYYLYVGTSVGAKDLVNTGETTLTSFQPADLPLDRVVYARLWTKAAGVWRFVDSAFSVHTVAPVAATITAPPNGTTTADLSQPIRWTTVAGAPAYYLYVGTSVGAKDLIDSGETAATVLGAATLPPNRTLYARLWTRVSGRWVYADSTFSGAPIAAAITVPAAGTTTADFTIPIQWTVFPGAQCYYLYVGTTPGGKDLINTGEIQQTSYSAANLPANQTLYARLWTKVANSWRYTDSTFRGGVLSARLTTPAPGATDVPTAVSIQWTTVPGVQAYYLYVGTTLGAKDLVNSGEIRQTQFIAKALPGNQTVYARIWTKTGDVWRYADSQFTTLALATLSFPADGAVNGGIL